MILNENRLIYNRLADCSTNTAESLSNDYIDNINEVIDDILVSEDSLLVDSDNSIL